MNLKKRKITKLLLGLMLFVTFNLTVIGLQAQNSVTVTVNPTPGAATVSANSICGTGTVVITANVGSNGNTVEFSEDGGTTVDGTDNTSPYEFTTSSITAGSTVTVHVRTYNSVTGCYGSWTNSAVATANLVPGDATISANSRCGTGTVVMTAVIGSNGNTVEFSEDGGTTTDGTDNSSPYTYTTSSITAGSTVTVHVRTYNSVTGCYGAWTNSAVATANTVPTANAGADPGDITCANPTRALSGSGGGSYAWSTADGTIDSGDNTATPTISAGGTYSLTVTVNGCASSNSATVVVGEDNTIPDVATISTNTRCGTGTVIMTAGIGANGNTVEFSEDGGTTTDGTDNTSTYNYTTSSITAGSSLTVHVRTYNTTNGCASAWTNSATATAYTIPTANAGADPGDITCANPTRTLSGSGGGSYAWSTADGTIDSGGNTATPTISAGGTYSLTVTVNGCASSNSATVVVGSSGTIPDVATISANTRCGTGTVVMTASIGANGNEVQFSEDGGTTTNGTDNSSPYNYTTSSITAGSTATIHVRTYNTATGCASAWTNSATATAYTIPTANAGADPGDITCANSTRTLSGSGGGSYAWSTADGTIDSGTNTATPTISAGGTYSLTVTVNGCASSNSATVVVGEDVTIPGVATITGNTRCGTGTVIMTAGIGANGNTVEFSEDGGTTTDGTDNTSTYNYTTSSITEGSTATVHVRTYNSTNGCASAWTNSATATAYVLPTATVTVDDATICNGVATNLNIALTGTANWTIKYKIDAVQQTDITGVATSPETISVNPSATSTYTVTEVSDANCTTTY